MSESESNPVIDLGAVSVETKGMQTQFAPDDLAQHKPSPGLADD